MSRFERFSAGVCAPAGPLVLSSRLRKTDEPKSDVINKEKKEMNRFTLRSALVLAVLVLLAGATTSYAQFTAGSVTFTASASNPQVRAQGITEPVGDVTLQVAAAPAPVTLTAGASGATLALSLTFNGAITNKIVGGVVPVGVNAAAGTYSGINVANATSAGVAGSFTNAGATLGANVSGNIITVTLTLAAAGSWTPAVGDRITIHGVRVNASGSTGYMTASVTSAPSNIAFLTGFFNPLTVGVILPGLATGTNATGVIPSSGDYKTISNQTATNTAANTPVTGYALGYVFTAVATSTTAKTSVSNCNIGKKTDSTETLSSAPTNTVGVRFKEGFVGAFTTATQEAAKSGSEATVGTRFRISITSVPTTINIYAPELVANGNLISLTRVTGADSNGAGGSLVTPVSGTYDLFSGGGTYTIVYEVTSATPSGGNPTTVDIPLDIRATSAAPPDTGTLGIALDLAPVSTVTTADASAPVVRFLAAPVSGTITLASCATDILFTFVSNKAGTTYDTGFAIANTGQDHLGTSTQTGKCSLMFFDGSTTGKTPQASYDMGLIGPGVTVTALLSVANPGFQGYAIAKCSFQYAHGLALVVNGYQALAAPTVGFAYPGLVFGESRAAGHETDATVESLAP